MRILFPLSTIITSVSALSLTELCTKSNAQSALPVAGFYNGITVDSSSVVATIGTNYSIRSNTFFPDATINYCNISFAYTHNGRGDLVHVAYWVPEPSKFRSRFLATGGGGLAINSGASTVSGGVSIGAVSGYTDGGFGNFNTNADAIFLLANGTVNWESAYMFGYQAIHEMTVLGKELARNLFGIKNGTKLYAYYQGCSEGGREGWSQVQRYSNELDGASIGAPAFRYSHQQIQHLYSNVVEKTLDYYPPPCEMMAIVNATIKACDPLDGKRDGVVARTDLCKLHFNINSTIGLPYSCAAFSGGRGFGPGSGSPTPAQNGTISAKAVAVAQTILNGIHDLHGRQVYFSYQPSATFADAQTSYNNATGQWELSISGLGAEFVTRYIDLVNSSTLPNLNGVTYDTLKEWIYHLWQTYDDSFQVNWPDLTRFEEAGGKVIHYHGESDDSIPAASSVRYWESVRSVMYPGLSYNDSATKIQDFYRLFLVPGGAHCGANQYQPNGAWPQNSLTQLIDWVEKGIEPNLLNGTVSMGAQKGENQKICLWPLRPYYGGSNGTELECVYDQVSLDTWHYNLDAWKMPVW
ncbi:tannase and feruloyl esterase [Lindgomyces ingoldianus]|uniref:Tannase and feruloyl esterase n=1 Tax=Lindgomyces ingoldianus TaxID=673940 RepID=A0ACB6QFD9_9PLEO|nr:tannase and feruloyl esterase [Lindgomyces ingoldianus]KAF2465678.1 tannase and feruloyl esterase [Lindgomyces ingoldianus]